MPSGYMDRWKGKTIVSSGSAQQFGRGSALTGGGGQIQSAGVTSSSGITIASTAETTLATYSLPANSLDANNRNLLITAFGTYNTTAFTPGGSTGKLATMYFSTATVSAQSSSTSAGTVSRQGGQWFLQMNVFRIGSKIQTIQTVTTVSTIHQGSSVLFSTADETTAITIKVTGTSTNGAADDVSLMGFQVEALN